MTTEGGLSKNRIIGELTRSPHGALPSYLPIGIPAARQEPDFFAHLIAWNEKNGQIRDAKVALPIIGLHTTFDLELRDNCLAHLALLDPKNFLRAISFSREVPYPAQTERLLRRLVESYLRFREASVPLWDRAALQHRASMKSLYARFHIKPDPRADAILFKGHFPPGSIFDVVRQLPSMSPSEAAGAIIHRRLPFLIASGALGAKAKEPSLVLALIGQMSASELTTNSKMLERLGVSKNPALRGAYEAALQKAAASKKVTLKTSRAAEAVSDSRLKARLQATQEKQISRNIEGDWLVVGDKSPSMREAIEVARQVAAILARSVKGKVHLIFVDDVPYYHDVTGKSLEEITLLTRRVQAGGRGTNLGCPLTYMREKGLSVNGIAIITDQGENARPVLAQTYQAYCKHFEIEPPVYCYWTAGDSSQVMSRNFSLAEIPLEVFDLRAGVDYYSLPNLVQTMNTRRYTLIDQIMETPLLTLKSVFTQKEAYHATAGTAETV